MMPDASPARPQPDSLPTRNLASDAMVSHGNRDTALETTGAEFLKSL